MHVNYTAIEDGIEIELVLRRRMSFLEVIARWVFPKEPSASRAITQLIIVIVLGIAWAYAYEYFMGN